MDLRLTYLIVLFTGFTANVIDSIRLYYWMQWKPGNSVPITAFEVEQDRYVGRVNTRNGKITAMIGLKRGVAVAIHHKKGLHKNGVEILCTKYPDKLYWEPIDWANLLKGIFDNALIAGFQKDISSYLYVGRARHPNLYKIGKVIPPNRKGPGLWIWENDQLLRLSKFELLKLNNTSE